MSLPTSQNAWVLAHRPTDDLTEGHFVMETRPVPKLDALKQGQVLVKNTSFSNDPAQRLWMDGSVDPRRLYIAPILEGEVIRGSVIGTVVLSNSSSWQVGETIFGEGGWEEYSVVQDSGPLTSKEIKISGQSPYIVASILGLTGQTAYLGAFEEMQLKAEHTLVVSGAAGGVGSTLVQIAKHVIKCKKVIGLAGGKQKCDWVRSLGADESDFANGQDKDYQKRLDNVLPDYADFFFDNVGGEILDHMLTRVKRHGRIIVLFNRLTIKGMLIFDHTDKLDMAVKELTQWLRDGLISNTQGETVIDAKFEDIPSTYLSLFTGGNQGKLITRLV
ncbi:MAG: hypothetical protein TREMPRED_000923 [Tremellales sp. Tagirdzhanova-0007]|nr:MAG: hypothetical protein TREMPRED_000923 [Tremellales sp. Tagirdzhanova-0007]